MKKILVLLGILLGMGAGIACAFQSTVWQSSNSAVAVSTINLCAGQTYLVGTSTYTEGNHGVLHGVCINTAAAGNIQIFNSSATATNSITGVLNTGTIEPCNFYDVGVSSGLSVNRNGTADVTVLYQCY
jgi:hypothetical protein